MCIMHSRFLDMKKLFDIPQDTLPALQIYSFFNPRPPPWRMACISYKDVWRERQCAILIIKWVLQLYNIQDNVVV